MKAIIIIHILKRLETLRLLMESVRLIPSVYAQAGCGIDAAPILRLSPVIVSSEQSE